ncbi:FdrA protein [Scopulibacillus darangshiensis]|uniref:FdrA protein n=1 Tax=Scopulibacillus darangshiensis TaxID=442528 RepID=A0A4R2NJD8_9BACL|nr:acyl-CoA synthetase FdrA [Scopulibacillus darangshiensis]TCP21669.1 FdrA protein [Scopulibacillus darangshiensis]
MLYTVIKKNMYQDSVNLMLLTNHLSSTEGVDQVSVMMGTPANIDIFKNSGLYTEQLDDASPNDLCIVVDTDSESVVDQVVEGVDDFVSNQSTQSKQSMIPITRTWEMAQNKLSNANLAVISIAGEHAASEANKALDRNLNVFLFSDNVPLDDEVQLKRKAQEKGLIVMGPDCGTGILHEVPIAFANVVEKGNIGVVGASGTGIQEITTIIARKGGGISQAIGTGGRDLSADVGAITAIKGLEVLAEDPATEVIVFVSKPPAPEVRDKVVEVFKTLGKPVVAVFMGEKPREDDDNVHYAWTLEETALKALEFAGSRDADLDQLISENDGFRKMKTNPEQRFIKGYYCGGTLALEAAMIVEDAFNIDPSAEHPDGKMLEHGGTEIIDLGDDAYTQGRAHPMIDPALRVEMVKKAANNPETAVILLDNVVGYGGHEDMAGVFAPVIKEAKDQAEADNRDIVFIASVTGTEGDPQVYEEQVKKLEDAGAVVAASNAQATRLAVGIISYLDSTEPFEQANSNQAANGTDAVKELISDKPRVINIGLKGFAETIRENGGEVVQYQWAPIAGGNKRLAKILEKLK